MQPGATLDLDPLDLGRDQIGIVLWGIVLCGPPKRIALLANSHKDVKQATDMPGTRRGR